LIPDLLGLSSAESRSVYRLNPTQLSPIAAPHLAADLNPAQTTAAARLKGPSAPQLPPPQLDEERLAWLAMALSPGLGPKRILDAVRQIGTASRIFTMPLTALEGLRFPAEAAQFLFDGKGRRAAEDEWARVVAQGATLLSFACREYPERLREIYDPPPVLWVRGDVKLLSRPAIAVVGTRHPTPYGSGVAEMLSRDLAARRLLIVSGMARGIDSCAGSWQRRFLLRVGPL
jgi:DNA processing protein